jgi:hypothetical protein
LISKLCVIVDLAIEREQRWGFSATKWLISPRIEIEYAQPVMRNSGIPNHTDARSIWTSVMLRVRHPFDP